MLDGQTQLTAMFGPPERLSKDPRPAPAPVVTPPGSRSKRKWAPANAIPPLALPPLKSPKKAVPPGWMRYGLAPALRVEMNRGCSRRDVDIHTDPRSAAATSAATTSSVPFGVLTATSPSGRRRTMYRSRT